MDIEVLEAFSEGAPPSVVEAMRHTVANMLGTLPPAFINPGAVVAVLLSCCVSSPDAATATVPDEAFSKRDADTAAGGSGGAHLI